MTIPDNDLTRGRAERDSGMRRVSDPTWSKEYRAALLALGMFSGIGEDFRRALLRNGLREPGHPNAWGANFNAAIKARVLELTNEEPRQMTAPSSHGRGQNLVYRISAGDLL